jgi:PAS domain S-box-containing protein
MFSWENKPATLSFLTDINERVQAEKALKESEERYRSLYESSKDGIAGGDMEGSILECNQAYADMLGYTREEIMKLTYKQLTPKKWRKMEADIVKNQILARGYSDEYEKEYIRKDGTKFPISARVWLRKDEKGEPLGMWGIARDITERKQAEKAMREREAELEIKTNSLEEANTALKVLLKRRDEDRIELEEKVFSNVKELIFPYMEKLKNSQLDDRQIGIFDIIESNLSDIISPFLRTLSGKYLSLTPKEIHIASLIKGEATNKEIAKLMNLSIRTIEFHRKNIREKLDIKNRKVNLGTHLLSIH